MTDSPTKETKCVRCANGHTRTADGFHLMSTGKYKRCADLPPYEQPATPTSKQEVFRHADRLWTPEFECGNVIPGDHYIVMHGGQGWHRIAMHVEHARKLRDWLNKTLPPVETAVDNLRYYLEQERSTSSELRAMVNGRDRTISELNQSLATRSSDETNGNDAEDAAKWRALRNCARITAMGSAGMERPNDPDAHVTLNFWTHNERETEEYPRRWLDTFVKKARALRSAEEPVAKPNDAVRWICPVCTTVNSNNDARCCIGSCAGRRPEKASGDDHT